MPVKIRLARHGRKRNAYYYIVAADGRAPRDGKFIERLGNYNPNTNPATIELNFDRALHWLENGAQPTDTARAILSYKGVLMKKHLLDGVKKGAFDEAAAEQKFNDWMTDKSSKIQAKVDSLKADKDTNLKAKFEAEKKVNDDRAQAITAKNVELAKEAEAAAKAATEEATAKAEAKVEVTAEASAEEAPAEEKTEE
ncbi:MAG: 30S ribosomal protein S16 [Salinivirgaceae bacterium]|nr:30S ribosomal protein S16 [Salinivirgaceae bacterium]